MNIAERLKGAALGLGVGLALVATAALAQVLNPVTILNGGAAVSSGNPLPVTASGGSSTFVPSKGATAYSAATVGTSDSTILAASTATVFLDVANVSLTATMCLNFGSAATISGTQCPAGELYLPPGWHRSWEGTFIPTDAIHAIASAPSTQASVGAK